MEPKQKLEQVIGDASRYPLLPPDTRLSARLRQPWHSREHVPCSKWVPLSGCLLSSIAGRSALRPGHVEAVAEACQRLRQKKVGPRYLWNSCLRSPRTRSHVISIEADQSKKHVLLSNQTRGSMTRLQLLVGRYACRIYSLCSVGLFPPFFGGQLLVICLLARRMDPRTLSKFAVPAVVSLIAFLSYSSQYLFRKIEPGPLNQKEILVFNALVASIWLSYARACTTDPGRIPLDWKPDKAEDANSTSPSHRSRPRQRYCRKCNAFKPPRAHHCRVCRR